MLSIRCTVIETGVLGGGLKLDEKTCLQYLSDLHQFLYNNRKQTEDQNCFGLDNNALSITRQEWYDFGSQSTKPISSVLNTLLNESEIEALWSLFATIVIVEGFIYVSKTQTVMNRFHGIQNEIEPSASTPLCNNPSDQNFSNEDKMIDPYIISIDFRYFGLLLFLQTKKTTGASRNQLYHRLLRASNNEVVYSNPAAAAAAYQHAAQVTGGLVSPRSNPRHSSISPNHTHNSSLLLTSAGSLISPRAIHTNSCTSSSSHLHSIPQSPAEDFKEFILSNLNTLLRIVHYQYTNDVDGIQTINPFAIDALAIYIDWPSADRSISSFVEIPQQGNRPKANTGLTTSSSALLQKLAKSLTVDSYKYPVLCRTSLSPTLSGLIASTSQNSISSSYSPSHKTSLSSSTSTPSSHYQKRHVHSNQQQVSAAAICIEGIRRETIIRGMEDQLTIIKGQYRKSTGNSSVIYQEKVLNDSSIDGDGIDDPLGLDLDGGSRSISLPTREEMRMKRRTDEFDNSSKKQKKKSLTSQKTLIPDLHLAELSECTIYILRPVRYVRLQSCKDCSIIVPSTSGVFRIIECSNISVHAVARCFKIENSYETNLNIFSFTSPIVIGDTRGLKIGPYNCLFSEQQKLMDIQSLQFTPTFVARWASPVILTGRYIGRTNTISSSSPTNSNQQQGRTTSSSTNREAESTTESVNSSIETLNNGKRIEQRMKSQSSTLNSAATILRTSTGPVDELSTLGIYSLIAPDNFKTIVIPDIPNTKELTISQSTPSFDRSTNIDRQAVLMLPQIYADALKQQQLRAAEIIKAMQQLTSSSSNDATTVAISKILHLHFVNWLQQTGHIRDLTELSKADMVLMKALSNKNNRSKHKQQSHSVGSPVTCLNPTQKLP